MQTGDAVRETVLETVRIARGMTQVELAVVSNVSQATISKAESGTSPLTYDHVLQIASALRVPPEVLAGERVVLPALTACVFHRKRASTTIGQAKQARARLSLARMSAEALLDMVGTQGVTLTRMSPASDGYVSAEDIARRVRHDLEIPAGPLKNLIGTLEAAGVIVLSADLGARRLDALSDWPPGRRPVLFINATAPGERQRFTLAHETGHAVMHEMPSEGIEQEADRFAAELLMPAADIRDELATPTLERLLDLKRRWRVSAAALARRAFDLGTINDYTYRRLNTEMSASGWRTAEPIALDRERPTLLATALQRARGQHDDASIATQVCLLPEDLDETFADRRAP